MGFYILHLTALFTPGHFHNFLEKVYFLNDFLCSLTYLRHLHKNFEKIEFLVNVTSILIFRELPIQICRWSNPKIAIIAILSFLKNIILGILM